jgi:hypothetical protein
MRRGEKEEERVAMIKEDDTCVTGVTYPARCANAGASDGVTEVIAASGTAVGTVGPVKALQTRCNDNIYY